MKLSRENSLEGFKTRNYRWGRRTVRWKSFPDGSIYSFLSLTLRCFCCVFCCFHHHHQSRRSFATTRAHSVCAALHSSLSDPKTLRKSPPHWVTWKSLSSSSVWNLSDFNVHCTHQTIHLPCWITTKKKRKQLTTEHTMAWQWTWKLLSSLSLPPIFLLTQEPNMGWNCSARG